MGIGHMKSRLQHRSTTAERPPVAPCTALSQALTLVGGHRRLLDSQDEFDRRGRATAIVQGASAL